MVWNIPLITQTPEKHGTKTPTATTMVAVAMLGREITSRRALGSFSSSLFLPSFFSSVKCLAQAKTTVKVMTLGHHRTAPGQTRPLPMDSNQSTLQEQHRHHIQMLPTQARVRVATPEPLLWGASGPGWAWAVLQVIFLGTGEVATVKLTTTLTGDRMEEVMETDGIVGVAVTAGEGAAPGVLRHLTEAAPGLPEPPEQHPDSAEPQGVNVLWSLHVIFFTNATRVANVIKPPVVSTGIVSYAKAVGCVRG